MSFFDGNFRNSKRKVDLRGSSKNDDKAKLLEKAREEREKRERIRRENKNAKLIQAFYRGRTCVSKARCSFRKIWKERYGLEGEKAGSSQVLISESFLRELLFFIRVRQTEDVAALAATCRLVVQATESDGRTLLFCSQIKNSENIAVVTEQAKRLLSLCFEALLTQSDTLQEEFRAPRGTRTGIAATLMEAILVLTAPESWTQLRATATPMQIDCQPASSRLTQPDQVILRHLVGRHLFSTLRVLLVRLADSGSAGLPTSQLEGFALTLCQRHVAHPELEVGLAASSRFAVQILSIPLLWQRCPYFGQHATALWAPAVRSLEEVLGASGSFLAALPTMDSGAGISPTASLLGNLLEVAADGLKAAPSCDPLLRAGNAALAFTTVASVLLTELPRIMYGGREDEPMEEASTSGSVPPALQAQLACLGEGTLLQVLVAQALRGAPEQGAQDGAARSGNARSGETKSVLKLCVLLYRVLTEAGRQQTRVLTGLAYYCNAVPRLWQHLRVCHATGHWGDAGGDAKETGSASAGPTAPGEPGWLAPLSVFCPVFSFMLMTTDDEAFFEECSPLPTAELPAVVDLLKNSISQLLLADVRPPEEEGEALSPRQWTMTWMSKLLTQLHDRNCRRRFVKPEAFHSEEAVGSTFVAEVPSPRTVWVTRCCRCSGVPS
ncbi:hypothetical protein CYMTET_41707 [Cymbomonas tetramitiformis]|uniref:HECT-type E3 ubiquitin transferase n=1 Tax=Cymbomonas tetramitiformis TaxID=36881 RepID=A0AAE0F290_9CHLO|nr:hypothetical protein CYMTET_41707 [Cymbomonas tetramitiformis]